MGRAKFDVTVRRTERRERVFRVEAEDSDAAVAAGLAAAYDYDFRDGGDNQEVEYRALAPVRCLRSLCKKRLVGDEKGRA